MQYTNVLTRFCILNFGKDKIQALRKKKNCVCVLGSDRKLINLHTHTHTHKNTTANLLSETPSPKVGEKTDVDIASKFNAWETIEKKVIFINCDYYICFVINCNMT